jgi:hypothetical protein
MTPNPLFPPLRGFAAKLLLTVDHQASRLSAGRLPLVLSIASLLAAANATASGQAVTYTGSGAVNFGSANVCPAGKTTPAPCSQTATLTYKITESGSLGTPQALTTGAANLDYKVASGTTCAGSVTEGNTCKVNVSFAPTAPGARNGAVEIVDGSGNALATTYIHGTGVGPRAGFSQPAQLAITTVTPSGVAVDGKGNVFVGVQGTQGNDGFVEELLAVHGTVPANPVVKVLAQAQGLFANPSSVAVDGAGNVFFTVTVYPQGGYAEELLAADGYATNSALGGDFFFAYPAGIAVDGSGNVFVSDMFIESSDNFWPGGLYEIPISGGYGSVNTLGGGSQSDPQGIALDAKGNLFAATDENVLELSPADGYASIQTINATNGQSGPRVIALDAAGDLFAAFPARSYVQEFFAVDGTLPATPSSRTFEDFSSQPYSLAVDGLGNLYVGEAGLEELQLPTPSTLYFDQTVVGHASSDSPKSVLIQNEGNAALDLSAASLDSSDWTLVKGSGTPEDCAAGVSLAAGALCDLSIRFEPQAAGPLAGAATPTDNSLNAPGAQQPIQLRGTGDASSAPQISSLNTTYAAPYSVVILNGTNFGATQGSGTVTFNGIATPHYHWTNTQIYVTVPPNAATGNLVVNKGGESSNPIAFTILPQPVLTGMSPTSGPAGSVVTITGKNLVDYKDNLKITFTGAAPGAAPPFLGSSSTFIQVQIPPGAVTGHFHVLVNDTGMNTPTFTVTK